MKSGKAIEVSKSSLVSLKAELLRKQEEALKAKTTESYIRPPPKPKKEPVKNVGVEERSQKDFISQEEIDIHKKSREVLEIKAKLYDKLEKRELIPEHDLLVDFGGKEVSVVPEESKDVAEKKTDSDNYSSSDDSDWTEYVDCLGRSRRCLKEDLPKIKVRDEELCERLGDRALRQPEKEKQEENDPALEERKLELMSNDMQRELMRQKWEEQEKILANKKNIYYEDVKFDEARSHGVGYYSLSTDEAKREEQLAEFRRVREETEAKQKEAKTAKDRREAMKQARLVAARQRQRQRLGLPPLPLPNEDDEVETGAEKTEETIAENQDDKSEDLEAQLKRAAHVRPWDVGKDGINQPEPVMTQEEWVEKKRSERPDEFAPPSSLEPVAKKKRKKKKVPKPAWKSFVEVDDDDVPGPPVPPQFFVDTSVPPPGFEKPWGAWPPPPEVKKVPPPAEIKKTPPPADVIKRPTQEPHHPPPTASKKGVEVPPPISFSFHTPTTSRRLLRPPVASSSKSSADMMDSIEAGLQFLRDQSEKREKLIGKK